MFTSSSIILILTTIITINMDNLPTEINVIIFSYLDIDSLMNVELVSMNISQIVPYIWQIMANQTGIKKIDANYGAKKEYFSIQTLRIDPNSLHYHIARYFGPSKFLELPAIKYNETRDYIDFITINDVTAPISKGIDSNGRQFISIRYIKLNNSSDTGELSVITIFNRYKADSSFWCSGICSTYKCLDFFDGRYMGPKNIEIMNQLLMNGQIISSTNTYKLQ